MFFLSAWLWNESEIQKSRFVKKSEFTTTVLIFNEFPKKKSMESKCITPWTPLMKMSVFTNSFFHKMSSLVFLFSCSTVRKFLLIVTLLHENTKASSHCSKPCIKKSYPHPKNLSQGYQEQKKEKRRKCFFY